MNNVSLELSVSRWFNAEQTLTLEQFRGRVVVIGAFQMLCPGCVSQSIPQLIKLDRILPKERVVVMGLHTVFEHHAVMGPEALAVFIHEYGLKFPVAVDAHESAQPVPRTMQRLRLQGTPSTLLLDASGQVRLQHFGHIEDLALGMALGQLLDART
jgi:peroxiredoxin